MRAFFRGLFGLVLRIFFRRIEISGLERVPREGPVIFVLNHPNGLIDPGFLLCLAPRRVSFLAKAPLFRMPVIGIFCRAFEAIPVHRRQDAGAAHVQSEHFKTAQEKLPRYLAETPRIVSTMLEQDDWSRLGELAVRD